MEFNSFRKRLYVNIDNTGEKMVNSIKNITTEFESINGSIISYFKRILNRNTEFSSKLEFPLNNLKEATNNKATKLNKLFRQRADQLKTLKNFLYPPKIVSGIVIPDELKIDWDERYERLKHLRAYRKHNNDLQQKLKFHKDKMNMMNKAAVLEERERNIRYKDGEKKRRDNQINFLKEQEERELEMINEMEKFEKELDKGLIKENDEVNNSGNIVNNNINNNINNKKDNENNEEVEKKEEEEDEGEGEEEEDDENAEGVPIDYTKKNTPNYPRSDRKNDISSIPAPSSLMNNQNNE